MASVLDRSSSFESMNSGKLKDMGDGNAADEDGEHGKTEHWNGSTRMLFGALYTLAKEKVSDVWWVALLNVSVDFLLILSIFLHLEFPWAVDFNAMVYKVLFWFEIQRPLAARGMDLYTVIFYATCAILYVCIAACVWVAWGFKNDSFPFLWHIKFARIVASIFFGTFYIASLNIFFTMAQCVPSDGGSTWTHSLFYVDCLSLPLIIHVVVALVSAFLFVLVNLLLVMADHDLRPLSTSLLANPHSMTELKIVCCKTILTAVDVLCMPLPKLQAVVFALTSALTLWWSVAQLQLYVPWMNCLRAGLYSVLAWVAAMLCVLVFTSDAVRLTPKATLDGVVLWAWPSAESYAQAKAITDATFYAIAPIFFLGFFATYARLSYFFNVGLRFRALPDGVKSRRVFKFASDTDVEVVSRVMRVWDLDHVQDPDAMDLGEAILRGGMEQFPNSPFVKIAYASFLIECKGEVSAGWLLLEQARKLRPHPSYLFSIFTWEQEQKQRNVTAASGNNAAADLVSYVEFQKHYKNLQRYHREALTATRSFWRMLLRDEVSLSQLSSSFRSIDVMESLADQTYRVVLQRYPSSVKLLRAYAGFLETVKHDPWASAKYYAMADEQEEAQEIEVNEGGAADDGRFGLFGPRGNAVITITAAGVIQSANRLAYTLFGYQRGDLDKQNVKMLMPQPFSGLHDSFLRNYTSTGKAKILNSVREVLGQHQAKHAFPMQILVTKASGTGADAIFMGVLRPVESDPAVIRAWLLPAGTILCVDDKFVDYAGWGSKDLLGKPFSTLGVRPELIEALLERAAALDEQQLADGLCSAQTSLMHKYGEPVGVHLKFQMGGTQAQRLLVVSMTRTADADPLAAFDHRGNLIYANSMCASLLQYQEVAQMLGMHISLFMVQPYSHLHTKWLREQEDKRTRPPPSACRSGVPLPLVTSNATTVVAKISVNVKEMGDHNMYVVKFTKVHRDDLNLGRRLRLHINGDGVICYVAPSPPSLFRFKPSNLLGMRLPDVIDMFNELEQGGGDTDGALQALLMHSEKHSGASWRCGIQPVYREGDERPNGAGGLSLSALLRKRLLKQAVEDDHILPAVMQVRAPKQSERNDDPTAAVVVSLWRPDMITGVVELRSDLTIARADTSAALVMGWPQQRLHGRPISHFLSPAARDITFAEIMGVRRGARAARMPVAGPRRVFDARHPDGAPLQLSLQGAQKNGQDRTRAVVMLKVVSSTARGGGGAAQLLALMFESGVGPGSRPSTAPNAAGDQHENESSDDDSSMSSVVVPKLRIGELAASAGDAGALATVLASARSRAAKTHRSALLTARDVELDLGSVGGSGGHLAHASTAGLGGSGGLGMQPAFGGGGGHGSGLAGAATMDEDELHEVKKSLGLVKGWIDSGCNENHGDNNEDEDGGGHSRAPPRGGDVAARHRRGPRSEAESLVERREAAEREMLNGSDSDGGGGVVTRVQVGPKKGGSGGGTPAPGDIDDDSPAQRAEISDSDFMRGQRLKRLTKLLSGRKTTHHVRRLRTHIWFILGGMLLLHAVCLAVILALLVRQRAYAENVSAAGRASAVAHEAGAYALAVDAAFRGLGGLSVQTHMSFFAQRLSELLDSFEQLHSALYLGMPAPNHLPSSAKLTAVWTDVDRTVVRFNGVAGGVITSESATTSLWELGGAFVDAGRHVAFIAAEAADGLVGNYNMGADPIWLFARANTAGALADGYLELLDTLVVESQQGDAALNTAMIAAAAVEIAAILFGFTAWLAWLLRGVVVSRKALFTVFLFIPSSLTKKLAGRPVHVVDPDEQDVHDDEARRARGGGGVLTVDRPSPGVYDDGYEAQDSGSLDGDGDAGNGGKAGKRIAGGVGFAGLPAHGKAPGEGGGNGRGGGASALKRIHSSSTLAGTYARQVTGEIDSSRNVYNGKKLTEIGWDVYMLMWPLFAIAGVVLALYVACIVLFGAAEDSTIDMKLMYRVNIQVSRLTLLSTDLAFRNASDAASRAALQSTLASESERFDMIYRTSLFGGGTLTDSVAHGANDFNDGCVFDGEAAAAALFVTGGCRRTIVDAGMVPLTASPPCANASSPYHAFTAHAIDPMAARLRWEALRLSADDLADVTPTNSRFQYIWAVGRTDLYESTYELAGTFTVAVHNAYNLVFVLQIVLLVLVVAAVLAFMFFMFRPFLRNTHIEAQMVAELLAQLPSDMEVEAMVAATYKLVQDHELNKKALHVQLSERSAALVHTLLTDTRPRKPSTGFFGLGADAEAGPGILGMPRAPPHGGHPAHLGGLSPPLLGASKGIGRFSIERPASPLVAAAVGPRPDGDGGGGFDPASSTARFALNKPTPTVEYDRFGNPVSRNGDWDSDNGFGGLLGALGGAGLLGHGVDVDDDYEDQDGVRPFGAAAVGTAGTECPELFERLGGEAGIETAVEVFYQLVLDDPQLSPFFKGIDMEAQKAHQAAFLGMSFGGAARYSGREIAAAHASLIREKGLCGEHFDLMVGHLMETLTQLDVAPDAMDQVAAIVAPLRKVFESPPADGKELLRRLGGEAVAEAVVDTLHKMVMRDPELRHFFDGLDAATQRAHHAAFIASAFADAPPPGARGAAAIAAARAPLIRDKGLNTYHFDLMLAHLIGALQHTGVADQQVIGEVAAAVAPLRDAFGAHPDSTPPPLYERLGGRAAVSAAVDAFYERVLADRELLPFFEGVDVRGTKAHQVAFLTTSFGGPNKYSGRSIAHAHAGLIKDRGLGTQHFDRMAAHLAAALHELRVPTPLVKEVAALVAPLREVFEGKPERRARRKAEHDAHEAAAAANAAAEAAANAVTVASYEPEGAKHADEADEAEAAMEAEGAKHADGADEAEAAIQPPKAPAVLELSGSATLAERLGGEAAVTAAVDLFYKKVLCDDALSPFFEGVDMERQKAHQIAFMTAAFGDGVYTGRSMAEAHAKLIQERGLNEQHFDLVAGHLVEALHELGARDDLVDEVVDVVAPLRAVFEAPPAAPRVSEAR